MTADDKLDDLVRVLAEKGSPVGKFKGALYGVQLSEVGTALPMRTHALVFIEFAAKMAYAAGMSLDELQGYITFAYVDTKPLLAPPAAPERGSR